jgi:class 3 adenylate cyclase
MAARKTVTVVFCDIVDSTPLGERIDPEVHRRIQERYFDAVRGVLERHGGTVEKFIGDAAMAVFGIPLAHDDDALRAVRAASDLRLALSELNDQLERDHGVTVSIRTGVNTGEVVAGDPSEGQSFATGDAVATAQRLEASARAGEILMGEPTYRLVANAVIVEPVEPLTLKGKAQPVPAWRLLGVVEGAPPFPRRLDTPLVGRDEELARLREEFEAAVSDRRCRLATIVGPAGIGKSRLGNELLRSTEQATSLVGRCLPYGEGITYWPLRGIVLGAVGHLAPEHIAERLADAEDGARVAALVADAVGAAEIHGSSEETFWAIRRFIEHLARERPLILGVDELQWAEPTLLDLVEYLVGWTTDAPVLLLGLSRPELTEKRPSWPMTISLDPLSAAETEELADALIGDREVSWEEWSRITTAAEGNPLFLEQLVALAAEEGAQEAIPPSIHALLAARLDRLDAGERTVLEEAAVIGREFTRASVSALSDEQAVGSTLLSLVRRDLIEPDPSVSGEDGFRFRHVLIRDAAYLGISKESRAELHLRYAEWLRGFSGQLDEIVGYHLEQAFRYGQELGPVDAALATDAGERLARAGRRAVRRGDLPAAVNLLTRAAALLPDAHAERHELLRVLGSALMRTGDFTRAEGVLDEARDAAQAGGDTRLELRTLIDREFLRAFTSPEEAVDEIVAVADKAIPLLEELGDDLGLAKAWWLKSEVHVNACRWGARARDLELALGHARKAGDASEQATLASFLAQALYYGPTPVLDAIGRYETLLSEQSEDRSLKASITSLLAGLRAMQGEFTEARQLQGSARALYEELGQRFRIATIRALVAAEIESLAGRPSEAVGILRWAQGELSKMGATSVMSTIAAFLADALVAAGAREDAMRYSKIAEANAADADVATQVMWRVSRAKIDDNRSLAEEAVRLAEPTDYVDIKARALVAVGEIGAARRIYEAKGNVAAVEQLSAYAGSS